MVWDFLIQLKTAFLIVFLFLQDFSDVDCDGEAGMLCEGVVVCGVYIIFYMWVILNRS